jgi:hypothetical protein
VVGNLKPERRWRERGVRGGEKMKKNFLQPQASQAGEERNLPLRGNPSPPLPQPAAAPSPLPLKRSASAANPSASWVGGAINGRLTSTRGCWVGWLKKNPPNGGLVVFRYAFSIVTFGVTNVRFSCNFLSNYAYLIYSLYISSLGRGGESREGEGELCHATS